MKKILTTFLLVCCLAPLAASLPSDPAFKEATASFSHASDLVASFEQTKTIPGMKRALVSTGTMYLSTTKGIIWDIKTPYPSLMVVENDYIIQQTKNKTKTKLNVSDNQIFMDIATSLQLVFSGDFSHIDQNFSLAFTQQDTSWQITLTPLKKSSIATFLSEIIIQGSLQLEKVMMQETSGGSITYRFTNLEERELTHEESLLFNPN